MCRRDKGPNLRCLHTKRPHVAGRLWTSTAFALAARWPQPPRPSFSSSLSLPVPTQSTENQDLCPCSQVRQTRWDSRTFITLSSHSPAWSALILRPLLAYYNKNLFLDSSWYGKQARIAKKPLSESSAVIMVRFFGSREQHGLIYF